jgi:hypothetical protein
VARSSRTSRARGRWLASCEVSFASGASPEARYYRVDFTKAKWSLSGYTPQWTLGAGIEELHASYKAHGMT